MNKLKSTASIFLTLTLLSPLYPIYLNTAQNLISAVYPNAKSKQEAIEIIQEESQKLNITDKIELKIYQDDELKSIYANAYCAKKKDKGFIIGINKSSLDKIILRHELYHIARGDLNYADFYYNEGSNFEDLILLSKQLDIGSYSSFENIHLIEPRANLYSWTDIKL